MDKSLSEICQLMKAVFINKLLWHVPTLLITYMYMFLKLCRIYLCLKNLCVHTCVHTTYSDISFPTAETTFFRIKMIKGHFLYHVFHLH